MTNIINLSDHRPKPVDPWQHAQPSLHTLGDREELWSHPFWGMQFMIWATGSNNPPEPPSPSGGSPVAANAGWGGQLRVAA